MNVEIVGDGPVTLVIDSLKDEKAQRKLEKQLERENAQKAKQMLKSMAMTTEASELQSKDEGVEKVEEEEKKQE